MQFQWEGGRKLTSFSTPNAVGSYVYNSDGIRVYKEVNGNKTEYYLNGTEIETEITNFGGITRRVDYIYDENGSIYGFVVDNTAKYYYTKNLQGDVIGILDASGTQIVEYSYDAWGKATVSYPNNENLTEAQKQANYLLGSNNPFRYRGYYFDNETGFYYLNSRYYDPEIGRFISVDNQIAGVGGDILGYNMFAYCGNNPVNRVDPTGEAWWHWAIGAAIVVGFAAATVVTCGGSLALAAASVGMVASGSAALTTATTVAAAGFIGSATVYGASVMLAASTSETVEEFCDKGNWGTVVRTAFGGVAGSYTGYKMAQTQALQTTTNNTTTTYNLDGSKDSSYVNKRGWSNDMINSAINNGKQGISVNMANGEPCTVYRYPGIDNQYVVIENTSGSIVQVSNFYDQGWIPDPRIVWDP